MALEAVVFPQDLFGCTMRELFDKGGEFWGYDFGGGAGEEEEDDKDRVLPLEGDVSGYAAGQVGRGQNGALGTSCSTTVQIVDNSSSPEAAAADEASDVRSRPVESRRKRQRWRSQKNQEEVENQRMAHIAVERNRRKQMNEYLTVLRSLMPASFVQKTDQASIIGGAINFVKELEKLVQTLEAHKRIKQRADPAPFAELFTFSRYSSSSSQREKLAADENTSEAKAENMAPAAAIEVSVVDSHANLKVLSPRRPKLLLKLVVGLQNLHLTTLHLNVTTIDDIVFYSFSLKVEEECQLASVDEIATAVHQLVGKIQEEAAFDCTM
ncbi:transcription factor bHLH94-like [Curcuma longa]|uniref:transcription factor bHLH94-like n=1 Tax=Curcuma longa TaxID=136217 RepID=UPI003D9DDCD8